MLLGNGSQSMFGEFLSREMGDDDIGEQQSNTQLYYTTWMKAVLT